jgi:hypothetical protein
MVNDEFGFFRLDVVLGNLVAIPLDPPEVMGHALPSFLFANKVYLNNSPVQRSSSRHERPAVRDLAVESAEQPDLLCGFFVTACRQLGYATSGNASNRFHRW